MLHGFIITWLHLDFPEVQLTLHVDNVKIVGEQSRRSTQVDSLIS